jgi:hypothetical protein
MTIVSESSIIVRKKIGEKAVRKSTLFSLLASILLVTALPAGAQQPTKISRIGFLMGASLASQSARDEAFVLT